MAPPFVALPQALDQTQTLGAFLIGTTACCILWGVNCVLVWQYFSSFPNDHFLLKLTILWLGLLDLLFTISAVEPLWYWTIAQWGNMAALDSVSWGWHALPVFVSLLVTSAQLYFAFRVYALSARRNWWLPLLIAALSIGELGWAAGTLVFSMGKKPSELGPATLRAFTGWMATNLANDVLITGGMLWFLRQARSGFALTHSIVDRWSRLALETNLVTALGAAASLVANKKAKGFIYVALYFPTARIYFLSVLVAVNSRLTISAEMSMHYSNSKQFSNSKAGWSTSSRTAPSTPRRPAQAVHIASVTRQEVETPEDPYDSMRKSAYPPANNVAIRPSIDAIDQGHPFSRISSGGGGQRPPPHESHAY